MKGQLNLLVVLLLICYYFPLTSSDNISENDKG